MGSASELFFKILVAQDGASDQLGENCLESGQIDEVACRQNIAPPDVDQIAYRLEHKEGYADGQQDMSGRERLQACRLEHRIERINAKVGVFEVTKRGQIDDNAKRRQARSEEHTSELQSLMRNSYAVF